LAEGIIAKFPRSVCPAGVLTAMTNNTFLCLLVPEEPKKYELISAKRKV
jgi:hypothetical protein